MKKTLFCTFLKKRSESLDYQPYPGIVGKKIYENISKKAWKKWQKKQIILINEKTLNMAKPDDRKILEKEMINFLFKNNT